MSALDLLCEYQRVHALTYSQCSTSLPATMQCAADSLRQGGRLFYLGVGSAAIMGCIDFSEMPDTYGAPFDQTRAFVAGGWGAMRNVEGDISCMSYLHRIGLNHFEEDVLPTLRPIDTVVVVISNPVFVPQVEADELTRVVGLCKKQTNTSIAILITCATSGKLSSWAETIKDFVSGGMSTVVTLPHIHEGIIYSPVPFHQIQTNQSLFVFYQRLSRPVHQAHAECHFHIFSSCRSWGYL